MLEILLGELQHIASRRPRIVFQLLVALLMVVILEHLGVNIPLCMLAKMYQETDVTLYICVSMILFTFLLLSYLILVFYLNTSIKDSFRSFLEASRIENAPEIVEHIRKTCYIDDIKSKRSLAILSLITFFIYFLSIMSFIYVLDGISIIFTGKSFLYIMSFGEAFPLVIIMLILISSIIVVLLGFQRGFENDRLKSAFSEWMQDLVQKYVLENCIFGNDRRLGWIYRGFIRSIAPVMPSARLVGLMSLSVSFPYVIVQDRINCLIDNQAKKGAEKCPYKLKPMAVPTDEQSKNDELRKCFEEDVDEKKLSKGILNAICGARLYKVEDQNKIFLGLVFFFRTRVISLEKLPLRKLKGSRAITSMNPKEPVINMFMPGIDPSIVDFYFWLIMGRPESKHSDKSCIAEVN